ncbi:mitotic spindle assembly checkpoint protein MAD2 [Pseudohyphozyma bogoriensis]|nr:mitotic spindle assembly checkpoint protein MAD2 [Pseudohyphozyma bogoriensis]
MSGQKQKAITLAGSTKLVTELFEYSINSILYQRGIYPPEDFKPIKKYGLTLIMTSDERLDAYIRQVMDQVKTWILAGNISRLVMAIISKETRETIERWQFDIRVDDLPSAEGGKENAAPTPAQAPAKKKDRTLAEVQKDIQDTIRQIVASVSFLPVVEEKCVFNILVYTDRDAAVPKEWIDSNPHMIQGNAEQVKLRSFSTNIHTVEALVAYRYGDAL